MSERNSWRTFSSLRNEPSTAEVVITLFCFSTPHAEVLRLDDDADTLRAGLGHDGVRDLLGHPLLDLEAAREHVDDARELGDAEDLPLRDVADRALPVKRQEVVLAERVELDVLEDHHMVGAAREIGVVDDRLQLLAVAARQERHRLRDAVRRLLQSLAFGILSEFDDDLPHECGELLLVRFFDGFLLHGG